MEDESYEPNVANGQGAILIEQSPAVAHYLDDSFTETRRLRHDGWDGQKMARFCEALAETGVVTEACVACGMSAKSAYALRHRDPLFAQAWEAALSMARARLADELLTRSLKGSAEQIMRDGMIVGERHHFDNRLAFAILRRLDRRAELGATFRTPPVGKYPAPLPAVSGEWQPLLDALSEARTEDVARLLAPARPKSKGNEGNDPPIDAFNAEVVDNPRLWLSWDTDEWRTDYPPPEDFDGYEESVWGDEDYCRALSENELAALIAAGIALPSDIPATLEEDEAERDAYFAGLSEQEPSSGDS